MFFRAGSRSILNRPNILRDCVRPTGGAGLPLATTVSPQLEPILESHLAAILMGELLRPREDLDDTYVDIVLDDLDLDDDEFYASYELVHEPAQPIVKAIAAQDPTTFAAPTTKFVRVRDTSHDHIETKKYPREALEADTLQTPKYSAPYELIDIAHPPIATRSRIPRSSCRSCRSLRSSRPIRTRSFR